MFVAKQLKESNICEYLLYMWQVEDTIRAFDCDIDRIREAYIPGFHLSEAQRKAEETWFEDLIRMMLEEGKREGGHLQINCGTLSLLIDLHQQLLRSPKHPFYSAAYYKALPFIVELRARNRNHCAVTTDDGRGETDAVEEAGELETCLNCLYGVMLLRLQKKEVTGETQMGVTAISHLLALLSEAAGKEKAGELEL